MSYNRLFEVFQKKIQTLIKPDWKSRLKDVSHVTLLFFFYQGQF